jgi:6-phosphofructokinase
MRIPVRYFWATKHFPSSYFNGERSRDLSKRIGVVVGGGDCPGLNAVIRSVAKAAAQRGWETIGILGGYAGLLPPGNFRVLDYHAIHELLARGGTILGTANRGQFTAKVAHGESRNLPTKLLENVKRGMAELGIAALVTIGGAHHFFDCRTVAAGWRRITMRAAYQFPTGLFVQLLSMR